MRTAFITEKKKLSPKKTSKNEREMEILFGLIRLYIETAKPVGSETLRTKGFESLSSATIRNYFGNLESMGLLSQQHISGGRVPTSLAFRLFADKIIDEQQESTSCHPSYLPLATAELIRDMGNIETKEIILALQKMCEELSKLAGVAVSITAPRFDGELIQDVKVVALDDFRLMVIIITDFGSVYTEILPSEKPMTSFAAKRIESYFRLRLFNLPKPENLEKEEEALAISFYNETLIRYLVGLTHFGETDLFKTGLARLLAYPEFHDHPATLCESLSLFEEKKSLRHLLHETIQREILQVWIGDELARFSIAQNNLTIISTPYKIGEKISGAFAFLGPMRLPYDFLIEIAKRFSDSLSHMLTHNLYHFKIGVRTQKSSPIFLSNQECKLLEKLPK